MIRWRLAFCVLLTVALQSNGQVSGEKQPPTLRLLLSEVQAGSMSSARYCMLVFADHSFHSEKASLSNGKERERKIYEGNISDTDWKVLDSILESDELRKLNVQRSYVPLVIQDVHSFTISVRREKEFQNMEFMDDKSRKPNDAQLKPLLQWWRAARSRRMAASEAPVDSRCTLDSSHGVFSY
jgi:hypothetical protein